MHGKERNMQLSKVIFWDTDFEAIQWEAHARYVIERVVMYGTLDDWQAIKDFYGMERIKLEMISSRELDAKSLSFLSCVLDTPKEQFRCYIEKQLRPQHWIS